MTDLQLAGPAESLGPTRSRPSGPKPTGAARDRSGLLLALILTGQFMAVLDVAIVNVAVPTIRLDLHASGAGLQLVIAGYTIAYAVLLITGARLGARFGHRPLFQAGLAVFTASSLACGLAQDTGSLIAFRVLQGIGSALMVPQVMSLIQKTFTGAARARALGIYTAVLAGATVVGQILGGVLVSADLFGSGWRPVFLVNVPIGVLLLVAGHWALPRLPVDRERRLDLVGLVVLALAIGLLVVPLVLGHDLGWPRWSWLAMAASVLAFALFVLVERRIAARGGQPLIHGRVLRSAGLLPASVGIFVVMLNFSGFMFSFALHLQAGLGDSPLRAGLLFGPVALGFGLCGLHWQRLPARLHLPLPVAALLVVALGYLAVGQLMRSGGQLGLAGGALLVVVGAASGCAYSPLFARALSRVAPADAADASGVLVTMVQLGQVVGVSLVGTVFLSSVHYPAPAAVSGHALAVTTAVLVASSVVAAGFAARTRRAAALG
ncbi:MFS transporter [Kitasatospora sp. NBC_01250]|uniref:MFS transporter n=1 Tax=unclassified Kitasatospora TaxID=2633591 RepID=UPI002E12FCC3|nr:MULTISPECIES: MFS transporter [unclassified Kitasatospora]WSJ69557.1 MFS transporter [Kitasatospora sp. NBC_01302]